MAKKKQEIQLEGLDDIDFNKKPDIKAAQSVVKPKPSRKKPTPKKKTTPPPPSKPSRSIFAPVNKKRASFNIDEDLHKALKDYSYFEEIDMVTYIFEQLVKPDLKKKGYYPPKKRKK